MAFKKAPPPELVPASPERLLLQLPRRKIPGVLLHQGQMMQRYAECAQSASDVALQLPTGSGKTLVGLLIGEWRRRKNAERVVFLCPTRQLVNQVVAQAEGQYGLSVHGFTGPKASYNPTARAEYQAAKRIAVTTYSALFNSYPFFDSPDIIIADDAHASENYIASMWSVRIERRNPEHSALHAALSEGLMKNLLDATDYARLTGELDESLADVSWAEKLPTPAFQRIANELAAIVDAHVSGVDELRYPWQLIRDHLDACHVYLTPTEILVRPLIPPTWTHTPFTQARQRIFMSATLGEGGDLERLTGRKRILRLPVPEGWDRQGIGRRFFIFPEMSLDENGCRELRQELMKMVARSVVLVPNDRAKAEIASDASTNLGLTVFDATSIEESKNAFINASNAVGVFANRYDGIDFPGDECRLLFLDGLPKTTNAQERFLVTRMGAATLLQARIQTRVVQALGRCTRSLQDYSAVVVTGAEMTDYLNNPTRRTSFHPELQAELEFGSQQSTGTTINELLDNFEIFIGNDTAWEEVNQQILALRYAANQHPLPGIAQLSSVVDSEIDYQQHLWNRYYEGAVDSAGEVLAKLTDSSLQGYRALWQYLAGAAASYGERVGVAGLGARARAHFAKARDAGTGLRWLAVLARYQPDAEQASVENEALGSQIERLETLLLNLGTGHHARYTKHEKEILDGLAATDSKRFEHAQRLLGEMLGFRAGKHEANASPDPWWIAGAYCIVFEDHSNATTEELSATKARQAAGHPNWMRANRALTQMPDNAQIISVLVSPVTKAETGAIPQLGDVALWPLESFRRWGREALSIVRELRRTLGDDCDLAWRAQAQATFEQKGFDAPNLFRKLVKAKASKALKP